MNKKSNDRLNSIRLLNNIVSQKTIGAYNKISSQGELNNREKKIKSAFEKVFILHTSQRSEFDNLKLSGKKKRIDFKSIGFAGPALIFIIALLEIGFAFVLFIFSNQTIEQDSLASLSQLNTIYSAENIYLEPSDIDITIQTWAVDNDSSESYVDILKSEGFRDVVTSNSELDNKNCILQVPQNISSSVVGRIQKVIAKSCDGLDRIEDTQQGSTINIIINRNGNT